MNELMTLASMIIVGVQIIDLTAMLLGGHLISLPPVRATIYVALRILVSLAAYYFLPYVIVALAVAWMILTIIGSAMLQRIKPGGIL